MDTSTIVCISAYAIGLVVFPVLFGIVNSRLVVSDFLGDDDYIIFFCNNWHVFLFLLFTHAEF